MIQPYACLVKQESEDFEEYLKKIHLYEIFKQVFEEFVDKDQCKGAIKFIAYGFSIDSDMLLTQGNTWGSIAEVIYEKTGLPQDAGQDNSIYEAVCLLQAVSIRESIQRWLRFQNEENWTQYIHYRDLRRQFLALSLSMMKKNTGEIDIEAKMKAAIYSKDLLKMMEDARDGFIQNHSKLRSSVEAINKVNKDKSARSVANYAVD